jgi:hypothetical protein
MALADDPTILDRPIGFAFGVNRDDDLDVGKQRDRLAGLLRFVRTFASQLLGEEFGTTIEGYPQPARDRTAELRSNLRGRGDATAGARRLLSVLIDLMELEIEHREASPEDDEEDEEEFHDAILALIGRLLDRFGGWAAETGRLPRVTAEAARGVEEWRQLVERLAQ